MRQASATVGVFKTSSNETRPAASAQGQCYRRGSKTQLRQTDNLRDAHRLCAFGSFVENTLSISKRGVGNNRAIEWLRVFAPAWLCLLVLLAAGLPLCAGPAGCLPLVASCQLVLLTACLLPCWSSISRIMKSKKPIYFCSSAISNEKTSSRPSAP